MIRMAVRVLPSISPSLPRTPGAATLKALSSLVLNSSAMLTGASFTGLTVSKNDELSDSEPSETVTVTVAEPKALVAGLNWTVRLPAAPPRATLLAGSKFVSVLVTVI